MLTNKEVIEFKGSNAELCEALGKSPSADSPPHYYNFTAKSIKDRAKIAVAEGRGDQEFSIGRARKSGAVAVAAKATSATEVLPAPLLAIMPALAMKTGTTDVKDFIAKSSTAASMQYEAQLPSIVVEVLQFFGLDSDSNRSLLLDYAEVKTMRSILIDRINDAIKALSAINLQSLTNDRLDDLERCLLSFALTGDSDVE